MTAADWTTLGLVVTNAALTIVLILRVIRWRRKGLEWSKAEIAKYEADAQWISDHLAHLKQ